MNKNALIVFLKAPEKGKVKTRLSMDLDEGFVLELYQAFICDLLETLEPVSETFIYVWPPEKKNDLEALIGKDYDFAPQKGNDLGDKMANALDEVFKKGYERAILIGGDIPEITADIIFQAFNILSACHCVVGPSKDGGYYLIGFQKFRFSTQVFDGIEWSTSKALEQTISTMKNLALSWGTLPALEDIDTLEDLNALAQRVEKGQKIGARTLELLKKL